MKTIYIVYSSDYDEYVTHMSFLSKYKAEKLKSLLNEIVNIKTHANIAAYKAANAFENKVQDKKQFQKIFHDTEKSILDQMTDEQKFICKMYPYISSSVDIEELDFDDEE